MTPLKMTPAGGVKLSGCFDNGLLLDSLDTVLMTFDIGCESLNVFMTILVSSNCRGCGRKPFHILKVKKLE